jgi:hypothetical protein
LLDGFDFVPVTPITLGTGQYVIGAEGNSTSLDQFTFGKTASTTISSITLGGALAGEFGPPDTITFPGTPVNFATQGYFGPDFLVAVPEPSTIGLACLGALGLALRLRRSGLKVFWAFGLGKPISALAILLSVGGMCRGSSIAFSYSGGANTTIGGGNTYGFQFTPLVNIIVDSLGYIDVGQNGLAAGHQAGIWDSSGTLLTSATLTTGTLEGPVLDGAQFTYTAITPITLFAGNTYTIGAEEDSADPIFYDFSAIQTSAAPSLLTVSSVGYYVVNQGFAEPTSTIGNHYDIVNFTASAVPEPSSLALAGLGALALASRLRRSGRL